MWRQRLEPGGKGGRKSFGGAQGESLAFGIEPGIERREQLFRAGQSGLVVDGPAPVAVRRAAPIVACGLARRPIAAVPARPQLPVL